MIVFQILNEYNNPASNDLNDLCIFKDIESVKNYLSNLENELGVDVVGYSIKILELKGTII